MKRMLVVSILLFALAACRGRIGTPQPPPSATEAPPATVVERTTAAPAASPTLALPSPSPTDTPQRTTWLLLGGDNRAHRRGTGWGDKTDVMLLVSILETDPIDVVVVQFPRNLYVPVPGQPDSWMFSIYRDLGVRGLRDYVAAVFGVVPQGVFYVDMDGFATIVDSLAAAKYPVEVVIGPNRKPLTGLQALAFLRDNTNNWGLGSYDAGERVFNVFNGLVASSVGYLGDEPVQAVDLAVRSWGGLVETDQNVLQMYFLARIAVKILHTDRYDVRWVQLEEPWIVRGPTPIMQNHLPMRGMIANVAIDPAGYLAMWMQDCVFDQLCEADPEE